MACSPTYRCEISEGGDELRVLVYDGVLDVEIEGLPGGVEQHGHHQPAGQAQAQPLGRHRAGDDVPALEVAGQGRHDVDEEAGHLVQGVEHHGVLPGQDGHGDGAVAQHEVGLEPGAAEPRVRAHAAGEGLQQHGDLQAKSRAGFYHNMLYLR